MAESVDPWPEGQQAWARLAGWYGAPSSRTDDGARALKALTDVGLVRRLLDQAEFEAVRAARQAGRSWSEIAVRLGVTRQSAWERWRDLDEPAAPVRSRALARSDPAAEITDRAAIPLEMRHRRRRSTVKVPNVLGLSWDEAREVLHRADLVAMGPDPEDLLPSAPGRPDGVVVDQSPESGAKVPFGSTVTLWLGRGGSGVREPRRPKPDPKTARKMRDEVTGETVN